MNRTIVDYLSGFEAFKYVDQFFVGFLGANGSIVLMVLILGVACAVLANVMALVGGLGTYAERKISADLQLRHGPNRVGPYGILQFLADGVKMLAKEDIAPRGADKFLFYIAPLICMLGVFGTLALIPFSSGFTISQMNVAVFFLAAISSLVGVGIFLGGYASNSKWSLLGGMRGASQIISYEIPVGISMLAIVTLSGSMNFNEIIATQGGWPWEWYLLHNPFTLIGFVVFFIGILAETNRAPFDLPEAESELVSGYHTEYTGMRFAFFALAEYIEIFVVCAVAVALFLGGYKVPTDIGKETFIGQHLQLIVFVLKVVALYYVVIWIRWTLPRLRVDQLMTVCWKYLTPIAIFNLIGVLFWSYYFDDHSMLDLIKAVTATSGGGGH